MASPLPLRLSSLKTQRAASRLSAFLQVVFQIIHPNFIRGEFCYNSSQISLTHRNRFQPCALPSSL